MLSFNSAMFKNSKAFTIIEVVLVMVLVGILSIVAMESFDDIGKVSLDGAIKRAENDVRYAQQLARATSVNHGVRFFAGGNYEVYSGSPGNPVTSPETQQSMVQTLAKFPGVVISTNYQVEFNANGVPAVGGGQGVRFSSDGGSIREVYVTSVTGAVSVNVINP